MARHLVHVAWSTALPFAHPRAQIRRIAAWALVAAVALAAAATVWQPARMLLPLAAVWLAAATHPADALDARRLTLTGRTPSGAATRALAAGFVQPVSLLLAVPFAVHLEPVGWLLTIVGLRFGTRLGRALASRTVARSLAAAGWYLVALAVAAAAIWWLVGRDAGLTSSLPPRLLAALPRVEPDAAILPGLGRVPVNWTLVGVAVAGILLLLEWLLAHRDATRALFTRGVGGRVRFGALRLGLGSATWAIAVRTWMSWLRDGRYRLMLTTIVLLPPLLLVPLCIVGVSRELLVLVPLPLFALLLGWTLHNDVSYDATALWLHATGGLSGQADRLGRALPTLVTGSILCALGGLAVGWVDAAVAAGLLWGAAGGSSVMSTVAPYPVARPGQSPWVQPVAEWSGAFVAHTVALLAEAALAVPAVLLWLRGQEMAAIMVSLGLGVVVFVLGVLLGGAIFRQRRTRMLNWAARIE